MDCEKAYKLCMGIDELISALESRVSQLKTEAASVRRRLETAKHHGLGEHLLAADLLPSLVLHIACLDRLTSRAMSRVEE